MQTIKLSRRELELLRTIWAEPELTYEGLGAAMCIVPRTVSNHIGAIFDKLGVTTQLAAVKRGLKMGLLELPTPEVHTHRLKHVCEDCGAVFE